jgi:hypothetical protein
MEKNYNNRDFEQFVKQNADQYRMFPSEKVWEGIHNTLHTRRKWYGFGLALLIFTATAVTFLMLNSAERKQEAAVAANIIAETKQTSTPGNNNTAAIIAPVQIAATNKNNEATILVSEKTTTKPINVSKERITKNIQETPSAIVNSFTSVNNPVALNDTKQDELITISLPATKNSINTPIADNTMDEVASKEERPIAEAHKSDFNPMTIESITNSFVQVKRNKKLSWQFFINPTVSYRRLKENKPFIESAQTGNASTVPLLIYAYTPDVNSIVTHRPDIGFQLGFSAGYPLTKRLTLTSGLQFNVSKYDIRAYSGSGEVATIALNTGSRSGSSVYTYTTYRNIGGYRADWLHNFYLSASAPVGLELRLGNKTKSYVGVAANLQPTYVLGNRAYLISTDYKNYAEIPSLTRRWNINTGFEIFATATTGNVQWRMGPQVRYQTLSSFKNIYPIKEHLFDFGLKLGVTLK